MPQSIWQVINLLRVIFRKILLHIERRNAKMVQQQGRWGVTT
jgi:hypothetical protein